jgi:hypothetical protein
MLQPVTPPPMMTTRARAGNSLPRMLTEILSLTLLSFQNRTGRRQLRT